ncbi:MAG: hypothetical protein WA160_06490 [Pseudobdellovibrio sp.]
MKIPTMHENDLSHINYLISLIEKYDLTLPFDPLHNLIGNLLNKAPVAGIQLKVPHDIFNPNIQEHINGCFRIRKFKEIESLKNQIQDDRALWARPKASVNDYGRCHSPNQEILYCSNNMIVGLAEVGAEVGDLCAVARFTSKSNVAPIKMVLLGDSRYKFENDKKYNPLGHNIESQLSELNLTKLKAIEAFLTKAFQKPIALNEEYNYKLTSSVAKFYFNEPAKMFLKDESTSVEGILYPSIKANLKSYNLAIRNIVAQELLQITNIFIIRVLKIEDKKYMFEFIEQVVDQNTDGSYIWEHCGQA